MGQDNGLIKVLDDQENVLAIILRSTYDSKGIRFLTDDDYSQQMAYMHHDKGHIIQPHVHNVTKREIYFTKEVLFIKEGKLRCDFYSEDRLYLKSVVLCSGDVILLVSGGHGFECIEETSMIEIKQGPYAGEADKTRFKGDIEEIKWVDENE